MGLDSVALIKVELYIKALAVKTKQVYKTGVNHYRKFAIKVSKINFVSLPWPPSPSASTSVLCFFAASLCLKRSINSATAIESYVRHINE